MAASLAISVAIVLAFGRLGRRSPDAFALSLAAFIGMFLYPAVVIVPTWLADASPREVGGFLTHTDARGVLLLTIFGALGSWLASPALITLCAATRWTRGAARPAMPLLVLVVGVLGELVVGQVVRVRVLSCLRSECVGASEWAHRGSSSSRKRGPQGKRRNAATLGSRFRANGGGQDLILAERKNLAMPWTVAHPAAVLLLRGRWTRPLSLSGLAAGSVAPDVGY